MALSPGDRRSLSRSGEICREGYPGTSGKSQPGEFWKERRREVRGQRDAGGCNATDLQATQRLKMLRNALASVATSPGASHRRPGDCVVVPTMRDAWRDNASLDRCVATSLRTTRRLHGLCNAWGYIATPCGGMGCRSRLRD